MRITYIAINSWRNYKNIEIEIPEETTLVCLVGENGTGKSGLLELISAASHYIGLSPGVDQARGDPFVEPHSISIKFKLLPFMVEVIKTSPHFAPHVRGTLDKWDCSLTLKSSNLQGTVRTVTAESIDEEYDREIFASAIIDILRAQKETFHLFLDADRAYPPMTIQTHQWAEAMQQDVESEDYSKQWAYRQTQTLYQEWMKYFLAFENRRATNFVKETRRAKSLGHPQPEFIDHFAEYKASLQQILPHLAFMGADTDKLTLLFDSSGLELRFTNLSGGEREIAFLVGQIDRFKLRQGLLLLDEPELHLNPDLVRNWIAYLRDTVQDGQVWIATHSFEAVEVAGPTSTFVLERNAETRVVNKVTPLIEQPVLTLLSAALGSPAFSLSTLRFFLVEGERRLQERERFHKLCKKSDVNRFIEAGNCKDVTRKVLTIAELSRESNQNIYVRGIVDKDFRTEREIAELTSNSSVFVLPCHEIENFFLNPDALTQLCVRSEIDTTGEQMIRDASDEVAWVWILERAVWHLRGDTPKGDGLVRITGEAKGQAVNKRWDDSESAINASAQELAHSLLSGTFDKEQQMLEYLRESANEYARLRTEGNLWLECIGKSVLDKIPKRLGLTSAQIVERHVLHLWESKEVAIPEELQRLREFVNGGDTVDEDKQELAGPTVSAAIAPY